MCGGGELGARCRAEVERFERLERPDSARLQMTDGTYILFKYCARR